MTRNLPARRPIPASRWMPMVLTCLAFLGAALPDRVEACSVDVKCSGGYYIVPYISCEVSVRCMPN